MDESKFFEAVQSLAQSLSQWDLLIIAGSMVMIVSTDYYRPAARWMRLTYLLFLPSWIYLASSIYWGIQIQGSYVAYLIASLRKDTDPQKAGIISSIVSKVNSNTASQILCLKIALLFIAVWLVVYICWWVFADKIQEEGRSDAS
jgi:hypothetical protein